MTGSIPPPNPLSYEGQVVVPFIMRTFNPQTTFNKFPVPTIWINTDTSSAYILVSKALGNAVWANIGGAPGEIDTVTTPDMTVVVPTAGNINFLQAGGITITGSGSNVTFTASGGGIAWTEVSGTIQQMSVDNGYIADNGALVTLTLPATAALGSTIIVSGKGSGGWIIAQNSGQTIFLGSVNTTAGTGGSLASTSRRDSVTLVCTTANNEFTVVSSMGNITIV